MEGKPKGNDTIFADIFMSILLKICRGRQGGRLLIGDGRLLKLLWTIASIRIRSRKVDLSKIRVFFGEADHREVAPSELPIVDGRH